MKKIINGKKYDTETATEVGSYWNYRGNTDFSHVYEVLYRKKTGEFFLYGEGGPNTRYRQCYGSGYGSGEKIIPYTREEAMEWAEENLDAEEYEEIFGEVEE